MSLVDEKGLRRIIRNYPKNRLPNKSKVSNEDTITYEVSLIFK